jgi:putative Mg2+ transporter-C (MgtC) family protein
MAFDQVELAAYVALAMVFGAVIGFDREWAGKPAGLRTHMLVSGAAALLVILGNVTIGHFQAGLDSGLLRSDPIRVIEAVITGVSFLGAGTIIRQKSDRHVEGLTTAASLLMAAALGICVALSQLVLALSVTALVLLTLRGVSRVERWLARLQARPGSQE